MENINWGIIGCGNVCEVKSGPAFSRIVNSELVAVMRRNINLAADFARRHKVTRFYDNAIELINDTQVNAVYIATPPAFHEYYAKKCIECLKPVYIEKPVTLNAKSCSSILELATYNNIKVSVAHYRRQLPLFLKLKEWVTGGKLGQIKSIELKMFQSSENNLIAQSESPWRINPQLSGGGYFHDLAPHQLDILIWIFGSPIYTKGFSTNKMGVYEAPDCVEVQTEFSNNIHFEGKWFFGCESYEVEDSCLIKGDIGYIKFSFFRNPVLEFYSDNEVETINFTIPETIQQPMIEKVVDYFRGQGSNPCSLSEALISMEMMDSTL